MEKILEKDFEEILSSNIPFNKFSNKTFLVSGATGLIGSLFIKFLLYINKTQKLNIKVIGLVRNLAKAEKIFKEYQGNSDLEFIVHDLGTGKIDLNHIDYILHGASITQSKIMITSPVETIEISVEGTREMLNLAVKNNVDAMVYLSSMEIYGQLNQDGKITEDNLGSLNLSDIRSGYPESKRLCEVLCKEYSKEYGLNVMSARLAQTFGAGVLSSDNRVFAQFAKSVIKNQDIVLHTNGKSEGNYIYTTDVIKALLVMMLYGKSGESYNVSNEENHMTIYEMAQLVINNFSNGKSQLVIDIPKENMGYAPNVKLWLSNQKLKNLVGGVWQPTVNLVEMYRRLIEYYLN